ncbi:MULTISPECIES: hypothetical protein [unclassified Polaromonas]|jgi:hypothetical protein|uniref:hypothetical protein n=1 Tax=unclassified Polaromonas TaxID=2638319 RepID=UPI000BD5A5CC|nr:MULTISPECIES: hypothetical protein [unclassified Polaromonas]OYY37994.1 MAG: hypothetical protein B7Y60_06225 [Polaromonas sp. 35-63-35]OYZ18436.1 MAG: hypothetical protein B7Y28_15410 [Polaromonas sp. 16-63-31]OYZ79540.1 MAG: hypothetical protein B7Y09_08325 [Polaromonas sp. 24-63-21]OZA50688.1 MAG: hypothetical protein B7X88_10545 [Polaromonas sp. 17-63-33]OZA89545.1 MAG: hypothetical protein B7X65_03390 [Polaromonas sp. 39-63-25]
MTSIKTLLVLSTTFALLACSSMGSTPMSSDSTVTEATSKQLAGDVPLPQGAVIKQQDTLVMGSGNTWMGRLSLTVPGEAQPAFAWFRDNLPAAGWTLTSSSFSKLSLLTFTKAERVATVQMQGSNFGGNEVLITVAPAVRPASRP